MGHPNHDRDRRSIDLAEALGEEAADQLEIGAAKLNAALQVVVYSLLDRRDLLDSEEMRWSLAMSLEWSLAHLERAGVRIPSW